MVTLINSNRFGVFEYTCLAKDLASVYEKTNDGCETGSTLFVVDTREVYFWDKESKKWLNATGSPLE